MLINCDECIMQHTSACNECVVSFLLNDDDGPVVIDGEEAAALGRMASVGLLPPLRLVRREATG
jgi:hypothetical protein